MRLGLDPGAESDFPEEVAVTPVHSPVEFEHYQLELSKDGQPIELGRGAMGVTYKAFDRNLRCPVALKVVGQRLLDDESARIRFQREARAAARLRHPNVATVLYLGKKGRDYFYAMEFVPGESLEHCIRRSGPLSVSTALDIVEQVNSALGAAHGEQIVHRDIKPSNVMIHFGEKGKVSVKVIDFGLAKTLPEPQEEPAISTPGMFFGTAHFASPEQCEGKESDIRSDIYSLGVTLWEMLTAKVPFDGTLREVMHKHLCEPLPLEQIEHLPLPVVRLLEFMLEKNPNDRPQNPAELQSALRAARTALDSGATSAAKNFLIHRPRRMRKPLSTTFLLILILAALASLSLAAFFFFQDFRTKLANKVRTIAVLPFDNLSENQENEYFSQGLTSEVIYRLSGVSDLRVIARSSVLRYRSGATLPRKSLKQIGEELGAGAILESSVQRAENRIKVVSILYEPATDKRLWGASYDRDFKDVFTIENELAEAIVTALRARLSSGELATLRRSPSSDPAVYDLFLRARASYQLSFQDNANAIEMFQAALRQDPRFAPAQIGLAEAFIERVKRFHGEDRLLDQAIGLCEEAIAAEPDQLRGYTGLAEALNAKGAVDRMDVPVRKALEIAPNDWDANRMAAARLANTSLDDRTYEFARKCYVSSPNDPWAPYQLALICVRAGAEELAEHWMQIALNLEPDARLKRMMGAERLVYRGEYGKALPELRQLPPDLKTFYASAADLVLFCAMKTGDWQSAIAQLKERLRTDDSNPLTLVRLSLALHATGSDTEAAEIAKHAVSLAKEKLPTSKKTRWLLWDISTGCRLLNRKDEAYQRLDDLLAGGGLPDPVLGPRDISFDLFRSDPEFRSVLAELQKKDAEIRTRIARIEGVF
jgi:serine/threonine protein kinase/Tfp pilus assembly protein PilF